MSSSYLIDPLVFLVQTLFGLYTATVALRFLLQWVRADFYNPISQAVVRLTSAPLRPLRRIIPGYGGLDLAALVLIWLLSAAELGLIVWIVGLGRSPLGAFLWAIPSMVELFINLFLFSILIRAILSWVNPDPANPANRLLDQLTGPVMRPFKQLLPPIAGIDLAPLAAMIVLVLLNMLLIPPLKWLVASPV
ncbi:YggT family protein [Caldichromatium japonicum]|uniref:YggT family protein n=1 Tax=Caldichromatium japonicum TaxID=2699430 RepID=A0A6G7VA90_9GAMM|nr:YggT family protein [Caldichromatium japonicum]QIK36894.1 YggT family protein [Caldichromatium japonicum]